MRYVIRTVLISLGCFTVACLPARQVAAELPPEILADKYLIHAEQLHAAKDYAGAFKVMEKIIALQKEHNLKLSDEFHFKYAHVALSADSTRIALESVSKYLSATGKEGKFYNEALALLLKAEGHEVMSEEDFYNDVIKTQGTCKELLPIGSGCWMELTNHPECYVWNGMYSEGDAVVWAGKCSGHVPDGKGTLTWYYYKDKDKDKDKDEKRKYKEHTGHFQKGKEEGKWVKQTYYSDGPPEVYETSYVNGKLHGLAIARPNHWVKHIHAASVSVCVHGKCDDFTSCSIHRDWSVGFESFDENGNGRLVYRAPDGSVWGGSYVEGKKHGRWVLRHAVDPNGVYLEDRGSYVNGKAHGHWVRYHPNGTVQAEGSYVDGKKDGQWVYRDPKGTEWGGSYVEGKKHGHWVEKRSSDRDYNFGYDYRQGKFFDSTGSSKSPYNYGTYPVGEDDTYGKYVYGQGAYLDDVRNGEWVERFSNGVKIKGVYQDGKKDGTWLRYGQNEKRCWSVTYRQGRRVNNKKVKKKICQQATW